MTQFNLEKYLENPSCKVVTRLNKQVQIISTEGRDDIPIIALVEGIAHQYKSNGFHADVIVAGSNQCRDMGDYDLFFADEEELTEFENKLVEIIKGYYPINENGEYTQSCLKDDSKELLDLAKKEILKDLPKWKRSNSFFNTGNKFELGKTSLRRFDGYEIPYSELEKLQKEE